MDDSELDFVDLCSKLLKRVRKKAAAEPGPGRQSRKAGQQSSSQSIRGVKRKVHQKDEDSGSRISATQTVESELVRGGAGCDSGSSAQPSADGDLRAKDKVLLRMQEFKRACPQKMMNSNRMAPENNNEEKDCTLTAHQQKEDKPASTLSGCLSEPPESDEALALSLQQELDREAAEAQVVDLEDGGLFFCQICHRDLSHMSPEGRTQHLNRCLDQNEQSGPSRPPPSGVPECPICGKKFKTQKSRPAHLKRCSADMGVSPAVLLQALQRQAEESRRSPAAAAHIEPGGNKRKAPYKPELPARKKPRKKTEPLDEETMMALALSSSLLEQQKEQQAESGPSHSSMTPALKWKPNAAKGRVKKRKMAAPCPPPLLLIQDAETALARLQERVSALLLRRRAPSPPTPTRCPSSMPSWTGAAPLWLKSALQDGGSTSLSDFYATELQHLFTTVELAKPNEVLPTTNDKGESSVPPSSSQTASSAPSTPHTGELHVGSQALRDLMELAEDGMTLTQYGYADKAKRLSGFIQEEEPENQAEPSVDANSSQGMRRLDEPDADKAGGGYKSVALSRLSTDLSSMVNNPQLSDVQLQVDSGEVYFAHSFMVYTRCPLLAEMMHESGFGVQEEGVPAAQRVLLSDVPGQAVLALLRYLYTGRCSVDASLQPHVLELASRFDLQELEQLCRLRADNAAVAMADDQQEHVCNRTDQAFAELLRSMWNEEEEREEGEDDEDAAGGDGGGRSEEGRREDEVAAGDGEIREDQVNEEELEEIYEFAATQRQKEGWESTVEEEEDDEEDAQFTDLRPKLQTEPEPSLDRSYNRLFSQSWGVYNEGDVSCETGMLPQSQHPPLPPPQETASGHSGRILLQSSASVVDEPSLNLPVPGLSPRQDDGDGGGGAAETTGVSLKRDSPGPLSIRLPLSPDPPAESAEPELIVLSDSSDEMEANQSYTGIKSSPNPSPKESVCSVEFSPGDAAGCSPELSWLIPSTPNQSPPAPNLRAASTQTTSAVLRTQLFPRGDSSPPASLLKNKRWTSGGPPKPDAAGGGSRLEPSRNLRLNVSPEKRRNADIFGGHGTPVQPCSSTPLHSQLHQPPVPPTASPLTIDPEKQMKRRTSSESPKETESGSFHLPPVSDSSDQPSSSFQMKVTKCNLQHATESTGGRDEVEGMDCSNDSMKEVGYVPEVRESSFRQSFMDEPPIAFNDSWGLDACTEANPGCFSLRLEDTGDSSPSGRPGSFSSTSKPPSSSHNSIQNPAPDPGSSTAVEIDNGLLDSKIWDSWDEEEEEEGLPLSQRVNPAANLKTPIMSKRRQRRSMVPITPMPHYSDMDTPELKNKLSSFGVRPLPKRQMVLKLKEIHQYTHQLASSDSEGEEAPRAKAPPGGGVSCAQTGQFREPRAPATTAPAETAQAEVGDLLSASQGSNTSSTAASEESERSNPEVVLSSDGDSDSDVSSSQAASRLQDRLQAVRAFILSDSNLYSRILQYQPLVLSQLQQQLKAAGIRLGAAKLVDYLDSQCITFTTAKAGRPAAGRGKKPGRVARGGSKKKAA